jgi:hypothetical protein
MSDLYFLETTAEIANPKPDGRSRENDWSKARTIPAGTRFTVRNERISRSGPRTWPYENTRSPLGKLIVANSKTVEPELVHELKEAAGCDYDADIVLADLLQIGRITLDDLRAAAQVANARWDAQEAAQKARQGTAK